MEARVLLSSTAMLPFYADNLPNMASGNELDSHREAAALL